MSSNTLETAYANGQIIDASHINELTLALLGAFVGRDASGVPSPEQSLGTLAIPWGPLFCKSIIIDGLAIDTTQITSSPNRVISGKTRALSAAPDFLRPNGTDLSFQILGAANPLILSINNAATSVSSDITRTGFTAAPASNNTCLVNDTLLTNSKFAGEDGSVIHIDTVGTEISTRVGQLLAFKVGATSEIMLGYLRDATTITNVYRGYFFDSTGAGLDRNNLSNDTVLTLMSLGWVFIEDNGTTVDISYRTPTVAFAPPASPATGYYWYDIANQVWKRYSGTTWEIIDRILIGCIAANTTACIGSRCVDWALQYSATNSAYIIKSTTEILALRELSNRISVYGNELAIDMTRTSWNITTNLEAGLTEAVSTYYYFYLSENGQTIISTRKPFDRLDLKGQYHPYESWRCIGRAYNNASSNLEDVHQIGKAIDNYVGVIFDYGGAVTPDDCLRCDGSSLLRADYPELFNALGTSWGSTSADTFTLPDMRGFFKRGWANGHSTDPDRASRTGATGGATGDNVGSYQDSMYASHAHDPMRIGSGNGTGTIFSNGLASAGSGIDWRYYGHLSASGGNETRPRNNYVNMVIKYR